MCTWPAKHPLILTEEERDRVDRWCIVHEARIIWPGAFGSCWPTLRGQSNQSVARELRCLLRMVKWCARFLKAGLEGLNDERVAQRAWRAFGRVSSLAVSGDNGGCDDAPLIRVCRLRQSRIVERR